MKPEIEPEENEKEYPQDWSAYNLAQTEEQKLLMEFLSDLCENVEEPEYDFGRPSLPLSDMIFASALKVYSTFSLRRFTSLMEIAEDQGHIENSCSYATVSNYMNKEEVTPILHKLIELSSSPLTAVETDFAVDSSGFSTSRFGRYNDFKHGENNKYRKWVKAHLICGVKTNIITGVELTEGRKNDCPQFEPLVKKTAKQFNIEEVSADKAYSSRANHELVDSLDATAYIPFKSNTTGKARGSMIWKKMFHYFQMKKEEFQEHYHKRSNVETVFHMIKTKFGDSVSSKNKKSQINEVLLKILCHNICVVIQEMFELDMDPNF